MNSFRSQLHPSWVRAMQDLVPLLDEIEERLLGSNFLPSHESVMRAFSLCLDDCKVLIVGQDPYPSVEHAMGLSFSIPSQIKKFPPTLQNIFKWNNNEFAAIEISINEKSKIRRQYFIDKNEKIRKREAEIIQKYGKEIAAKILKGKYWKGMTKAMLIESLGNP